MDQFQSAAERMRNNHVRPEPVAREFVLSGDKRKARSSPQANPMKPQVAASQLLADSEPQPNIHRQGPRTNQKLIFVAVSLIFRFPNVTFISQPSSWLE